MKASPKLVRAAAPPAPSSGLRGVCKVLPAVIIRSRRTGSMSRGISTKPPEKNPRARSTTETWLAARWSAGPATRIASPIASIVRSSRSASAPSASASSFW